MSLVGRVAASGAFIGWVVWKHKEVSGARERFEQNIASKNDPEVFRRYALIRQYLDTSWWSPYNRNHLIQPMWAKSMNRASHLALFSEADLRQAWEFNIDPVTMCCSSIPLAVSAGEDFECDTNKLFSSLFHHAHAEAQGRSQ